MLKTTASLRCTYVATVCSVRPPFETKTTFAFVSAGVWVTSICLFNVRRHPLRQTRTNSHQYLYNDNLGTRAGRAVRASGSVNFHGGTSKFGDVDAIVAFASLHTQTANTKQFSTFMPDKVPIRPRNCALRSTVFVRSQFALRVLLVATFSPSKSTAFGAEFSV